MQHAQENGTWTSKAKVYALARLAALCVHKLEAVVTEQLSALLVCAFERIVYDVFLS